MWDRAREIKYGMEDTFTALDVDNCDWADQGFNRAASCAKIDSGGSQRFMLMGMVESWRQEYPMCNSDETFGQCCGPDAWNSDTWQDFDGDGEARPEECSNDLKQEILLSMNGVSVDSESAVLTLSPPHFGCGGNPDCGVEGKIFILQFTGMPDLLGETAQCDVRANQRVTAGPLKSEGINFARGLFGLSELETLPDNVGYCYPHDSVLNIDTVGNDPFEMLVAGTGDAEAGGNDNDSGLRLGFTGLGSATLADGTGDAGDAIAMPSPDPPFGQETCGLQTAVETSATFVLKLDGFVPKQDIADIFTQDLFSVEDFSVSYTGYTTTSSSAIQGISAEMVAAIQSDPTWISQVFQRALGNVRRRDNGCDEWSDACFNCGVHTSSAELVDGDLTFSVEVGTGNPSRSRTSEECFNAAESALGLPRCPGAICGQDSSNDYRNYYTTEPFCQGCDGWAEGTEVCEEGSFVLEGDCDPDVARVIDASFFAYSVNGDSGAQDRMELHTGVAAAMATVDLAAISLAPVTTSTTVTFAVAALGDGPTDLSAFADLGLYEAIGGSTVVMADEPLAYDVTMTPERVAGTPTVEGTPLEPAAIPAAVQVPAMWSTVYQWSGLVAAAPTPAPGT